MEYKPKPCKVCRLEFKPQKSTDVFCCQACHDAYYGRQYRKRKGPSQLDLLIEALREQGLTYGEFQVLEQNGLATYKNGILTIYHRPEE